MKALIVDDDRTLADLLAFTLRREGFEPIIAFDAPEAVQKFSENQVDVVILDINLPGEPELQDGFAVCKAIRSTSNVPIILLTVRAEEEDILHGLEIGADDYISKPFSPRQLVARVQAVVRRSAIKPAGTASPYSHDQLSFDPVMREVKIQGQATIRLTRLEAILLEYFMLNPGYILPIDEIITHVWGPGAGSHEMLRQLVRRLRTKIEQDPSQPSLIQNLPGIGYGFSIKP